MSESKTILSSVLLALQLCLGFWQIMKLTPVGAVIKCTVTFLLSFIPIIGSHLSPTYTQLKGLDGTVFKKASSFVAMDADTRRFPDSSIFDMQITYLGKKTLLERREENLLFVNGEMAYYITDTIWLCICYVCSNGQLYEENNRTVFLKGYKEFWEGVATGGVLSFSEVLDSLVLDNQMFRAVYYSGALPNDEDIYMLLPVNLSVSEEKTLKALNLVGLFLQTKKQVHWLIPTCVSFVAAVLEFSTPLRVWIYEKINNLFTSTVQLICDKLPFLIRRRVYSLGSWVENLKPSNDLEMRVVRGDICALIGGGAKAPHKQGATLLQMDHEHFHQEVQAAWQRSYPARTVNDFENILMTCDFYNLPDATASIGVIVTTKVRADKRRDWMAYKSSSIHLTCNTLEGLSKVITFVSCLAQNRSGSLKSCSPNNKVRVRGLEESMTCYVKNGLPAMYQLNLGNTLVNDATSNLKKDLLIERAKTYVEIHRAFTMLHQINGYKAGIDSFQPVWNKYAPSHPPFI